jgi:hypothetical protein
MKTYDKEGFAGLTHLQLVQMRCETVEKEKRRMNCQTEKEEVIVETMGWHIFDKAFFLALEMVKSGVIKIETGEQNNVVQ